MGHKLIVIGAAALLLAGCEMMVGGDGDATSGNASAPATPAKDGEISIDTPGFDMKLDIPDAVRSRLTGDGDIIYPGSKVSGLNVRADQSGQGRVEMRFTSPDLPAQVAAWYRDPARAATLAGVSVQPDGNGFRISGSSKDGTDPFELRLAPGAGGGTQGQLTMSGRGG